MTRFFLSLWAVFGLAAFASAEVTLPNIIGSDMVLQQGKATNLWGWAEAGEDVTVSFGEASVSAKADGDGKWSLQLPAQEANAEPQTLTIKGSNEIELTNILVGEVWICSGQSNMEWPMTRTMHKDEEIPKADHPNIRLFNVPKHIKTAEPQDNAPGAWAACSPETVPSFSATGYHFGQKLHAELGVPIGLVGSNWGGTQIEPWTPKAGLDQVDSLKEGAANGQIYNGMVHPLKPFTMRGIIWYQGESNCLKGDTTIYTDRTLALVKGWRTVFEQDDLSFYFVQIAPFVYAEKFKARNPDITEESLPQFWEAQTACLDAVTNSGMVVVTDITGNVNDIHPGNKRDVGRRLARWALAKNYGKDDVVYSGPIFKAMKIEGAKATLSFDHIGGGLASLDNKPLSHFQVAGADKQFKPAAAEIKGDTVVVSAAGVDAPVAVRFAWHEVAIGNLGNKDGLPAVQFRTDAW